MKLCSRAIVLAVLFSSLAAFAPPAEEPLETCGPLWGTLKRLSRHSYVSPFSIAAWSNLRSALRLGNIRLTLKFLAALPTLHAVLQPRELNVHSSKLIEVIQKPGFQSRFDRLNRMLASYQTSSKKTLWQMVLELHDGRTEEAIDFMTLFIQDEIGNELVARFRNAGVANPRQVWDQIQATRAAIEDINNRTQEKTDDRFSFATIDGQGPPYAYNNFYHFYAAAYLSKELVKRGVDPNIARYLALLNGDTYEKVMFLPGALVFWDRPRLSGEPGPGHIDHPIQHIAAHIRGAIFGANPDPESLPSHEEIVQFVKRNFWTQYREIAHGKYGDRPIDEKDPEGMWKALRILNREKFALLMVGLGTAYALHSPSCYCQPSGDKVLLMKGRKRQLDTLSNAEACEARLQAHESCR